MLTINLLSVNKDQLLQSNIDGSHTLDRGWQGTAFTVKFLLYTLSSLTSTFRTSTRLQRTISIACLLLILNGTQWKSCHLNIPGQSVFKPQLHKYFFLYVFVYVSFINEQLSAHGGNVRESGTRLADSNQRNITVFGLTFLRYECNGK